MAQKVRVKVKKKKVNFKRVFIVSIIIALIIIGGYYYVKSPIEQIYITGNNILSESDIKEIAKINNKSSFVLTLKYNIKRRLLKNDYIKDVKIKKRLYNKLYIEIKENNIICSYKDKLFLDNGKKIDNTYQISDVPELISLLGDKYEDFIKGFNKIEDNVKLKISQIEYLPTSVDDERFLLYMVDGNSVYVTLTKITKLNKYGEIYEQLEGKNGIVYLDSGDYVEIK